MRGGEGRTAKITLEPPAERRDVYKRQAQRGTTVLVSSHNLRELEDVCDHVGIMDHGRVLLERSLALSLIHIS